MTSTSTVPFSPVPGHIQPMKFRADDTWTYEGTPLMVLAEGNYRDAAFDLLYGRDERARQRAATGIAMEDAYVQRSRDEYRREQEAVK